MVNNNLCLLDCTLRDGGFVNDWHFGTLTIRSIVTRLDHAGADIIEVGFLDSRAEYDKERSVYPDIPSVHTTLGKELPHFAELVAMIDYGTFPKELLIPKSESVLSGIRLIFPKEKVKEALEYALEIKNKGYKLFLNPIALFSYRDKEILELTERFNELEPEAVSIVDTYGVMFSEDVARYVYLFDNNLNRCIALGYHSHNNLQMSNANCIYFINLNLSRKIIIDSSILGMGKNSGNACTEILLAYIHKKSKKQVDLVQVLECAYVDIQKFLGKQAWGYNLDNLITAVNECSPNWIKFFKKKNTLSVENICQIISSLPPLERSLVSYYSDELAEKKYLEFVNKHVDDTAYKASLKSLLKERDILLLCPGKTLQTHEDSILAYIKQYKPIVITVNFLSTVFNADFAFISNPNRYSKMIGLISEIAQNPCLLLTSNIVAANSMKPDMLFNYKTYYEKAGGDNSFAILLSLLQEIGIRKVATAGLDGFKENEADNFFGVDMLMPLNNDVNMELIKQLQPLVSGENAMVVDWITPSSIEESIKALFR